METTRIAEPNEVLTAYQLLWTANCWDASKFKKDTPPTDLETMLMAERVLGMSAFERNRYTQQCALAGVKVDEKAINNLFSDLRKQFVQ